MLERKLSSLLVVVALAVGGCSDSSDAPEQASAPPQSDATAFTNFTLIDGTGQDAVPASAMVVEDGRIVWIGPTSELSVPPGAETLDLTGKFVMPGLIDLHVHLAVVDDLVFNESVYTRENVEQDLQTYASYGVTTVLCEGTDKDLIFPIIEKQRSGQPSLTRVYTAGQGLVFAGGYGGVPGINDPVATAEEAAQAVAEQSAKGVDFIKIWVDDELGTMPKMPAEISKAAIDAAHEHGLRAVAHVFYLEDVKRLVAQGVDGLVHGVRDQPVDQALIDSMKAQGTWQVAETLSREAYMFAYGERPAFLDDPFFTQSVPAAVREELGSAERQQAVVSSPHYSAYREIFQMAKSNLKALADGGVNYAFGTDSGPPGRFPGYSAHWELELMVDAGLTPAEALEAATGSAAEFLGADDLGTLEQSNWADFVVLGSDPQADIRNTRDIRAVYIAGNKIESVEPQPGG